MTSTPEPDKSAAGRSNGTGFFAVIGSVLAAGFGVQSRRNRERDFSQGKARHFVIAGLLGTVAFVLAIWFGVQMLLQVAG